MFNAYPLRESSRRAVGAVKMNHKMNILHICAGWQPWSRGKVKYSALFLCVALAGCTTPLLSPRLRRAEDSIPLADIVVGADPAERVRFAAGELKEHLDKITGASFAVVAAPSLGRGAITISLAHGLEPQETRIAFSRGGVSLESGAFPEYAVYDFLRDYCGVVQADGDKDHFMYFAGADIWF